MPDFVKLAEAYGCVGLRCERPEDVDATIRKAMEITDVPVVIDFVVERDAMVWPMVPAGVSNDAIQIARGLSPKWDREDDPATEQGLDADGSGVHHGTPGASALYPEGSAPDDSGPGATTATPATTTSTTSTTSTEETE